MDVVLVLGSERRLVMPLRQALREAHQPTLVAMSAFGEADSSELEWLGLSRSSLGSWARDLRRRGVGTVWPVTVDWMEALSDNRALLERHGIRLVSPPPETVHLVADRLALYEALRDVVPMAPRVLATEAHSARWLRTPLVIRPRAARSNRVIRLGSGRQLPLWKVNSTDVAEREISGREFACDALFSGPHQPPRVACWRVTRDSEGDIVNLLLHESRELTYLVRKTVRTIGLRGLSHLRLVVSESGDAHLIDVTPNASPLAELSAEIGMNLAAEALPHPTALQPTA